MHLAYWSIAGIKVSTLIANCHKICNWINGTLINNNGRIKTLTDFSTFCFSQVLCWIINSKQWIDGLPITQILCQRLSAVSVYDKMLQRLYLFQSKQIERQRTRVVVKVGCGFWFRHFVSAIQWHKLKFNWALAKRVWVKDIRINYVPLMNSIKRLFSAF